MESMADAGSLRLHDFLEWVREMIEARPALRSGIARCFADRVFDNDIRCGVNAAQRKYDMLLFKGVVRVAFFEFQVIVLARRGFVILYVNRACDNRSRLFPLTGNFDPQACRDKYRELCGNAGM